MVSFLFFGGGLFCFVLSSIIYIYVGLHSFPSHEAARLPSLARPGPKRQPGLERRVGMVRYATPAQGGDGDRGVTGLVTGAEEAARGSGQYIEDRKGREEMR